MPYERLRPSFAFTEERLARLREVAPEAFADGKVNWTKLREALGEWLEEDGEDAEHFGLTWPGKRAARRLAALPSQGTLVPVPGEGVNEDTTRNLFIEGDNLEVLKLLQKSYAGRVKMIYIDPPYNTGNDFVYEDDFAEPIETYLRRTGQLDSEGKPLTTNTRADGRFHSKWLSMMYPRLRLARALLSETGAIFVSIDDNEVANLRLLLNEVFGDENFVAQLVWQRSKKGDSKLIASVHEYVLVYARDRARIIASGGWRRRKQGVDEVLARYTELRAELGGRHAEIRERMREWYKTLPKDDSRRAHEHYNWSDERGLYFPDNFAGPDDGRKSRPRYDIYHPVTRKACAKPSTGWRWDEARTQAALAEQPPRIHFGPDHTTIPCRKSYLAEVDSEPFASVFYRDGRAATLEVEEFVGKGVFSFPKNVDVLMEFIELCTSGDDLVMDFFAGSGSTPQAVIEQNRKDGGRRAFVSVQLPEPIEADSKAGEAGFVNIAEVAKARIRSFLARHGGKKRATTGEDVGFRAFKLERSSFRVWQDYEGDNVNRVIELFAKAEDTLVDDWTSEGLLVEVMLLEGFPLDALVEPIAQLKKNDVTRVSSDYCAHKLVTCFDDKLYADTVKALDLAETDVFVCLDRALTDEMKIRLADRCVLKTI